MITNSELTEEEVSKIIGQYQFKVRELLEPLRIYGQEQYCIMVEQEFISLACQLAVRLEGGDIPYEIVRPHW